MYKQLLRSLSGVVFAGLLINPQALPDISASAILSSPPPPLAAAVASAQDLGLDKLQDSVLRVGAVFTGTITFPSWYQDDASGTLFPTDELNTLEASAYQVGTGFVVDSAGYLVTNAHVVDSSSAAAIAALWAELQQETYDNLAAARPEWTEEELIGATNLYNAFLSKYGSWDSLSYDLVVFNPDKADVVGDVEKLFQSGYKADVVKMGSPYPQVGKDVAIIKIEAEGKFKPLALGDSSKTAVGSTVYVIGFPAIADLGAKSFLVPTVTSGIVSAVKPSEQGDYNVIQVDAKIQGGNSGGPVFDDHGKVIGIASFGAVESDGYNWALPIELAKSYMKELNLAGASNGSILGLFQNISPTLLMGVIASLLLLACVLLVVLIFHHKKTARLHAIQQSTSPPPPSIASAPAPKAPVVQRAASPALSFDSLGRVTLSVFVISALALGTSVFSSDIFVRCSDLQCVAAALSSLHVDTTVAQSTPQTLSTSDFDLQVTREAIRVVSFYALLFAFFVLILLELKKPHYLKPLFPRRRYRAL